MARIAIFSAGDYAWSFEAWKRAIPELLRRYEVVGLCIFPDQLGKLKGARIPFWHLRVFGFWNFLILSLYAFTVRMIQLFSYAQTWKGLARAHGLEFHAYRTPNAEEVAQWVKNRDIDVVLITVGQILKKEIIDAPRVGIINKHAAILPSCRGIFPFFWAKVHNLPTGVTFHQVDEKIDAGKILVQKEYPRNQSMLRFYRQVFHDFPALAVLATERLIKGEYQNLRPDITPSYYGLPTRKEVAHSKVKIAEWKDLLYEVRGD